MTVADVRVPALADLRQLPSRSVRAGLPSANGESEHEFRGPLLWDWAGATGVLTEEAAGSTQRFYFTISAAGGLKTVIALAEVTPDYAGKEVLLAFEQDGQPLGGAMLVTPGGPFVSRHLGSLLTIELHSARAGIHTHEREPSTAVSVGGAVRQPQSFDAGTLAQLAQTRIEVTATAGHGSTDLVTAVYGGILVWELLERAGLILEPEVENDVLSKLIVAGGSDGYAVTLSAGELHPRFGATPALVASTRNGEPLAQTEGHFRLIVPGDRTPGRFAASLASIEVIAT